MKIWSIIIGKVIHLFSGVGKIILIKFNVF